MDDTDSLLNTIQKIVGAIGLCGVLMFMSSILFLKDDAPPIGEWTWKQMLTPWNNTHWYRSPGDHFLLWGLVVSTAALPIEITLFFLC